MSKINNLIIAKLIMAFHNVEARTREERVI